MKVINLSVECDEKVVVCNIILMSKCVFVWLSLVGSEPSLDHLVTAMETKFGVLSSTLMDVGNDKGSGLAQRIAKRFEAQCFVADNLPELEDAESRLVESKLVATLKEEFAAIAAIA
jgi:hypothetical protein